MPNGTTAHTTRRKLLKAVGAAGLGLAASGSASAAAGDHEGFEFRTVIDMIEAGGDPDGEEPIDDLLYELVDDHTLLQFPPGEYKLEQFRNYTGEFGSYDPEKYLNLTDFGMKGHDASLVAPAGTGNEPGFFEQVWIDLRFTNGTLLEGFTFDNTAPNTGAGVTFGPYDRGVVRDIDVSGVYDGGTSGSPFIVWVPENESGTCRFQDVRLPDGLPRGTSYETGTPGFFVFIGHRGVLELWDCVVEGFNNGVYHASPGRGGVQVEGGRYAHNNVAQVRVHGPRSHIKNVHMAIENVAEKHPNFENQRAVWVWRRKGLDIKNCTIDVLSPTDSQGAIVVRQAAGETAIENTDVRVDADGVPAVWATTPLEGEGPFGYGPAPPAGERGIDMKNVRITGNADGGGPFEPGRGAVLIEGRDGNRFKNCRVEQSGPNRDGVVFRSADASVRNTLIDVTGDPLVAENSDVETRNVRYGSSGAG